MKDNHVIGILRRVGPIEVISNNFAKRDIFIQIPYGKRDVIAKFQLINEECNNVSEDHQGMRVKAYFKIWGKDKGSYHFQNLNIWRLEVG